MTWLHAYQALFLMTIGMVVVRAFRDARARSEGIVTEQESSSLSTISSPLRSLPEGMRALETLLSEGIISADEYVNIRGRILNRA